MQQVKESDPLSAAGVPKPVIFFDDVCVMCNGFVNLLLRVDRRQQFLFAPLGGKQPASYFLRCPMTPASGRWSTSMNREYTTSRTPHSRSIGVSEVLGGC